MASYYTITPTEMPSLWQPEAVVNTKIQSDSKITSNWKYRQYMQKNANHIIKYNAMESIYSSGNNPYSVINNEPTSKNPYLFANLHDTTDSAYNSDLKRNFVSKQQLQARMSAPIITPEYLKKT
jgi:signal transduction histidine kinase